MFAFALLTPAFLFLFWSIRDYRAARLARGVSEAELTAAVRLQPGNAEYHYRLGNFLFVAQQRLEPAAEHLRRAVELNPRDAQYWLALANLYQVTGNDPAQLEALENATASSPSDPTVAWQAANYHLVRGELDRALALFQVVLLHDPSMTDLALELCWRGSRDVKRIMALLDQRPELYLALVRVLVAQDAEQAAGEAWEDLLRLRLPFRLEGALTYVNRLIEKGEGQRAYAAWNDALALQPDMGAYRHSRNLVVNAGFDESILNGGFDWRLLEKPGVRARIENTEFHGGYRSLAIEFTGEPVEGAGIAQYVPVRPGTEYLLTAHIKTVKLLGLEAPRLYVQEQPGSRTLGTTGKLQDAPVWRQETARFRTGPRTTLVVLRLLRPAEAGGLRGTILIDSVSLQEAPQRSGSL